MKARFLIPFGIFAILVVFLGIGLTLDPREVPSPLIGKPAPDFSLPTLNNPAARFQPQEMQGKVWLLNVWASWCTSCRAEHQLITELANTGEAEIVGLNYKDRREDAMRWLARRGDPYLVSVSDLDGRAGLDWGVYGVPETFVIDRRGQVRYKQIGPVTREAMTETLLPLIRKLKGERS